MFMQHISEHLPNLPKEDTKMLKFDNEYYQKVVKRYGYMFCNELVNPLEGFTMKEMSNWLCAYNLNNDISKEITTRNTLVIMGVGVNKEPHIGTISQILRAIYFQNRGYDVQVILGDLDSYNARTSQIEYVKKSVEKYRRFIIGLGFDDYRGTIRNQLDHEEVMKTAFIIASKVKDSDFSDVEEDLSEYYKEQGIYAGIEFPVKQAILLMFADFIHNGFKNKYKHIIVLSGIDEHTYVPKADEIAQRMGIDMTISGLFSSIIKGFNNQPKMSKSLGDSSIWSNMSRKEIEDLILNTTDEYLTYEDSIVYQLMAATLQYTVPQLETIAKICQDNSSEWLTEKRKFAQELFKICNIWNYS